MYDTYILENPQRMLHYCILYCFYLNILNKFKRMLIITIIILVALNND